MVLVPRFVGACPQASKGIKKTVFFATSGDKGLVRLWRSDSGACVHSTAPEGAVASAATEFTDLSLVPGDEGSLMVTTADARLLFYQVRLRHLSKLGMVGDEEMTQGLNACSGIPNV